MGESKGLNRNRRGEGKRLKESRRASIEMDIRVMLRLWMDGVEREQGGV